MLDIQLEEDKRDIPLAKVGIKGLSYPITVLDKENKLQHTQGTIDIFVNLPRSYKGTHMSRFVSIFHRYHKDLSMKHFLLMLEEVRVALEAQKAFSTISFPFYMTKCAPVTGYQSIMSYTCSYEGTVGQGESSFMVGIAVPIATVCPCSKAISSRGAHNQRGIVSVKLCSLGFFWIEDIIALIEEAASSGLYSLLKRPDEKYITESAYDKPRFVEDVVREVYLALKATKLFSWYSIECQTYESIHNHNAYAYVTSS